MIRKVSMALALAGVLQLAPSAQAGLTNLLTDGSFEAATLVPAGATITGPSAYGTTTGALPGSPSWTVSDSTAGTPRGVMIASTSDGAAQTYFGQTLPADPLLTGVPTLLGGTQVAYFIGDDETVSLTQTIATVVGQTYTFGFDAAVAWTSRTNAPESQLLAVIGGNTVLSTSSSSLPIPTTATSNNSWTHFEGTYTAIAPSLSFGFTYIGGAAAAKDILIDRVFVTTAVPEPGSMALAAIVSGIGGMAYRRSRARKNTAV